MPSLPVSIRPPRAHLRVWVLALLLVVGLVATPSSAAEAPRSQLSDVRDRMQDTLADLDEVAARTESGEEALADAEDAVVAVEQALNDVLAEVQAQEELVAAAQAEADAAEAERERVETLAVARARRAFMGGVPNDLVLLSEVGSQDLDGALDRLAFLDAIAARDSAAIEQLDVVRTVADAAAERLSDALADLEEARAVQEELLAEAEALFDQRADALAELETERERLLAEQEELEQEEASLEALIRQQEEEARRRAEEEARRQREADEAARGDDGGEDAGADDGGSDAAAEEPAAPPPPPPAPPPATGCYAWPAAGRVTSEYGPRWGRMHRGIDIDGDTGDSITAAQSGTVTFAGWYYGYGQMTLIRHGDGVTTAYAHQSSIGVRVGQTVDRGQYIGRIGTTGNVTGSHLHFETRRSSGAVNPRNYLC